MDALRSHSRGRPSTVTLHRFCSIVDVLPIARWGRREVSGLTRPCIGAQDFSARGPLGPAPQAQRQSQCFNLIGRNNAQSHLRRKRPAEIGVYQIATRSFQALHI